MANLNDDLAHENTHTEQDEQDTQAQAMSEEARGREPTNAALDEDSEKGPSNRGAVVDEDEEDLVDHMIQMDRSGTVDMSAYRGEETMDDLENRYGRAQVADEDFSDDDS
ncbi:hypothetical protein [Novosphingobium sp. 9]|uniref:hypothetical protein n=1 Tax=Novosphingobium sp. 9 TaxID=2025349 RepID=UPI0021B64EA0|nr:hypothetical protein [Novosphingobium sp. 9]